jgi:hypothetical protein
MCRRMESGAATRTLLSGRAHCTGGWQTQTRCGIVILHLGTSQRWMPASLLPPCGSCCRWYATGAQSDSHNSKKAEEQTCNTSCTCQCSASKFCGRSCRFFCSLATGLQRAPVFPSQTGGFEFRLSGTGQFVLLAVGWHGLKFRCERCEPVLSTWCSTPARAALEPFLLCPLLDQAAIRILTEWEACVPRTRVPKPALPPCQLPPLQMSPAFC